MVMQFHPLEILKIQDGGGRHYRHLEKYKNHHLGCSSSDFYIFMKFGLMTHYMYEPLLSDFVRYWCIFRMVFFTWRERIAGGRFWCAACNSLNWTCSTSTLLLLIV